MKLFKVSFYDSYQSAHLVVLANTELEAKQLAHKHGIDYLIDSAVVQELEANMLTTEPKAFFISCNED